MNVPNMHAGMHGDGARPPGRGTRRFLGSKRRRLLVAAAAAPLLAVGLAIPAMAVLAGSPSNFEANDGNMTVEGGTGFNDWNSVQNSSGYAHISDKFGTTADDSFQSGQKQDSPCPVINTNKNPPKDDFTDVASFNETSFVSGPQFHHTFLDGATIRVAANGNASENVELNQGTNGFCPNTTNQFTRTPGDKLIAIDYLNGGTNVQFHVLTWVASGACFVSKDTAPCWGATVQSLSQNAAEGLVNQSPIAATDNKINNLALVTGQFAEFGVDLTAAGILPANSCLAFPQTVWESRASGSSFVSSTEDVAVERHRISNCGAITIIKHTDPRGLDQVFNYTSNLPANANAGGVSGIDASGNFSLNDKGNTSGDSALNTVSEQAFAGSYTVTEGADPAGFAFESLTCTGGTTSTSGKTATITLAADDNVTCTYVNQQQLGALAVLKTSSKAAATPLAGATFSVTGPNNFSATLTTDSNGKACVGNLPFGDYSVTETAAPNGYAIDNGHAVTAHVGGTGTCSTTPSVTETFTDTPLTDITATATSEAPGGTQSTITCTGTSTDSATVLNESNGPAGAASVSANGLHPGTYTCTINIDP
jgi:Prealbumin-like fold domain